MSARELRHLLLLSGVLLALSTLWSCAAVMVTGQRICTANTKAECDPLYEIAESLHSPAMERAIADARK